MSVAVHLHPLLERRWSAFVEELTAVAVGGTLPIELLSLPCDLLAAGAGHRLALIASELTYALRLQAELLVPTTEGPRHAAFADVLAAIRRAGVDLGRDLEDLHAQWLRRPRSRRRSRTAYTFEELTPFVPARRR